MPIIHGEEGKERVNSWLGAAWIVGIVVFCMVLWIAVASSVWGLKVATAGIYGRGEARIRIESASNRIAKQELFEELHAKIQAYDDQINVAAESTSANRDTNLQGLKLICIDATAQYNAEAEKVSSEQFRDVDLPAQIDSIDKQFDCKEDKS